MIRTWVRRHEQDTSYTEIGLIQAAFELYSVNGNFGWHCHDLFKLYECNHQCFLQELSPP